MKFGLRIWRSGHVLINNERNKHLPGALTQCLPGDCLAIMLHNEPVIREKSTLLSRQRGAAQPASGSAPPGARNQPGNVGNAAGTRSGLEMFPLIPKSVPADR